MVVEGGVETVQPVSQVERDGSVVFHGSAQVGGLTWRQMKEGLLDRGNHDGSGALVELLADFGRGGDSVIAGGSVAH